MKKVANKTVNKKVELTNSTDASFEREIRVAIKRLPSVVREKAFKNNASITVVRGSKIVRINPDETTKVIGKINKIVAKVKIQKVMSLS
jgi:hypothetical protein